MSSLDAILVLLSLAHGAALLTIRQSLSSRIGLWWSAITIAHNFIHLPFFRVAFTESCVFGLPEPGAWHPAEPLASASSCASRSTAAGVAIDSRHLAAEGALVKSDSGHLWRSSSLSDSSPSIYLAG